MEKVISNMKEMCMRSLNIITKKALNLLNSFLPTSSLESFYNFAKVNFIQKRTTNLIPKLQCVTQPATGLYPTLIN